MSQAKRSFLAVTIFLACGFVRGNQKACSSYDDPSTCKLAACSWKAQCTAINANYLCKESKTEDDCVADGCTWVSDSGKFSGCHDKLAEYCESLGELCAGSAAAFCRQHGNCEERSNAFFREVSQFAKQVIGFFKEPDESFDRRDQKQTRQDWGLTSAQSNWEFNARSADRFLSSNDTAPSSPNDTSPSAGPPPPSPSPSPTPPLPAPPSSPTSPPPPPGSPPPPMTNPLVYEFSPYESIGANWQLGLGCGPSGKCNSSEPAYFECELEIPNKLNLLKNTIVFELGDDTYGLSVGFDHKTRLFGRVGKGTGQKKSETAIAMIKSKKIPDFKGKVGRLGFQVERVLLGKSYGWSIRLYWNGLALTQKAVSSSEDAWSNNKEGGYLTGYGNLTQDPWNGYPEPFPYSSKNSVLKYVRLQDMEY